MDSLAKPQKRAPNPRKPIARGSRPARVRKTASGRARHAADIAWAKAVRESGPCAASHLYTLCASNADGFALYGHSDCTGQIEAAHIISRRYAATRHLPQNGVPLCHGAHRFFTEHPLAWEAFCIARLGRVAYNILKETALRETK